jgi:hypothetical protein
MYWRGGGRAVVLAVLLLPVDLPVLADAALEPRRSHASFHSLRIPNSLASSVVMRCSAPGVRRLCRLIWLGTW